MWLPGICLNSHVVGESEVKLLSRVQLFETPWTVAYQVPPSMGFSRQEYWSEVPLPSPIMECYSAIKNNEIMPFAATWVDLEIITPSEVNQKEKDKYPMMALIHGI